MDAHRSQIGSGAEAQVVGRLGRAAILDGTARDGASFECMFYGTQPIMLEACRFVESSGGP